jgi:transposase-like protein
MTTRFPVRKPCPRCGKAMKLVDDRAEQGLERYVCQDCDDPMRNLVARKWVEGPLKPPEK